MRAWLSVLGRGRSLVLVAVLAVVVVAFVRLGLWQFHTGQRHEVVSGVADAPPVSLTELVRPGQRYDARWDGRRVVAVGQYDASGAVRVVDRRLDGQAGEWVVTPLVVADTGARLAVLRGFVPEGSSVPEVPTGTVEVQAVMSQPEAPASLIDRDGRRMDTIDLSVLVNDWGSAVYPGFVFATAEDRPGPGVTRVPPPAAEVSSLDWRNLGYAAQWWVFALFATYVVVRHLRDEVRHTVDKPAESRP